MKVVLEITIIATVLIAVSCLIYLKWGLSVIEKVYWPWAHWHFTHKQLVRSHTILCTSIGILLSCGLSYFFIS